jgi:hypothetical protein
MGSIRHGLKTCEKTLCNAKKFTIKANMDCYHLPLPVMNGYFKQVMLKYSRGKKGPSFAIKIMISFKGWLLPRKPVWF